MFARNIVKSKGEKNNGVQHPEKQNVTTRVSEYLRKYGSGQLDRLPTSDAPEIKDDRSVDEMLDEPVIHPGTDPVEVLSEIQKALPRFQSARETIAQTERDRKAFDDAVAILQDKSSTTEQKYEAYSVLHELEQEGKVKRARTRN